MALGIKEGLPRAIDAFREHDAHVDFDVVCVINDVSPDNPALATLPADITVVPRRANLGYTGGLHVARAHSHGEFLVWGQDDMTPVEGWLDALVDAADASQGAGMVGPRQVDQEGNTRPLNSGRTLAGQSSLTWPSTADAPVPVREAPCDVGWVSGAGALVRLSAWDAVGGVDLRVWPLNYVDLAFCAHVRAHGYGVVHAPGAKIEHAKHGSSTSVLLNYTQARNTQFLDGEGWPGVTERLGEIAASPVPHPCSPWLGADITQIEARQLEEASLAYLPLGRDYSDYRDAAEARIASLLGRDALLDDVFASRSWRVTAPLRVLGRLVRKALGRR
ncbi:glycosyltransferase [Demequina sp.]|uniref:glycosyltransferase family 2 protein n=1 Tax=Demequina sp. TaxID=2050685 RepID=UPI0025C2081E|nr:glycosyltransferase [Demequina sp.]